MNTYSKKGSVQNLSGDNYTTHWYVIINNFCLYIFPILKIVLHNFKVLYYCCVCNFVTNFIVFVNACGHTKFEFRSFSGNVITFSHWKSTCKVSSSCQFVMWKMGRERGLPNRHVGELKYKGGWSAVVYVCQSVC